MKASAQSGFTLFELLVTLMVAGILFSVGIPSFITFQRNASMSSAANNFVTGLMLARAEAVKRQVPVTLCASPNPNAAAPTCSANGVGANGGFIVWVDESGPPDANGSPILTDATDGNAVVDPNETILVQSAAPGGTLNVRGDTGYVSYGTNGFRRQARGQAINSATWIVFCDERGNKATSGPDLSTARALRIDQTGRGQVYQDIASIVTATAASSATCPP
jgi:type IV fimbrial biogenesis protein FimT